MVNKNTQRSHPARALASTPPYPTAMVYKRHLGGVAVAVAQYTVIPGVWTWTWTARECVVPSAHKEEVFCPLKPENKFRQRKKHINACNYLVILIRKTQIFLTNEINTLMHVITQLYINKEHAN
jgi:hypothetical protein